MTTLLTAPATETHLVVVAHGEPKETQTPRLADMVPPLSEQLLRRFDPEASKQKILQHCRRTVADIIEIGRELMWVKQNMTMHGEWEQWVKQNLPFSPSTARKCVEAARMYDTRSSTNDFNEQEFLREVWGNKPRGRDNDEAKVARAKEQKDLMKRLEHDVKDASEVTARLNELNYWDKGLRQQFALLSEVSARLSELVASQEARWRGLDDHGL
jgi:hypothetical protein